MTFSETLERAICAVAQRVLNFSFFFGRTGRGFGLFVHLNRHPYSSCLNPHVAIVIGGRLLKLPIPAQHWLYDADIVAASRRFRRGLRMQRGDG